MEIKILSANKMKSLTLMEVARMREKHETDYLVSLPDRVIIKIESLDGYPGKQKETSVLMEVSKKKLLEAINALEIKENSLTQEEFAKK